MALHTVQTDSDIPEIPARTYNIVIFELPTVAVETQVDLRIDVFVDNFVVSGDICPPFCRVVSYEVIAT